MEGGRFVCEKCGMSGDDYAEMVTREDRCGTAAAAEQSWAEDPASEGPAARVAR